MAYDGIHNITRKTQTAFNLWSTGAKTPNTSLSYDNAYAYAGGRPHAASQVGIHTFKYDARRQPGRAGAPPTAGRTASWSGTRTTGCSR